MLFAQVYLHFVNNYRTKPGLRVPSRADASYVSLSQLRSSTRQTAGCAASTKLRLQSSQLVEPFCLLGALHSNSNCQCYKLIITQHLSIHLCCNEEKQWKLPIDWKRIAMSILFCQIHNCKLLFFSNKTEQTCASAGRVHLEWGMVQCGKGYTIASIVCLHSIELRPPPTSESNAVLINEEN